MRPEILRILAIEDNPADFRLLIELLREYALIQFEVVHAKVLQEALDISSAEKFDVILLDLSLPDSQGLSAIDRLCKVAFDIPIVVLTGLDDPKTGIEALHKNAQDYLIKGQLNVELLIRSIRYAIERKRVEKSLRLSEMKYKSLAENVPSILIRYDKNLRIVYLSPMAQKVTGRPNSEFIGKTNKEAGFPEKLSRLWQDSIRAVFHTGQNKNLEFDFPIGERLKTFYLKFAPEFGPNSKEIDTVLGIATDITERKHAEKVLKRDKETFERLVEKKTEELAQAQIELEKAKRLSDIGTLAATVAHELRNPLAAINLAAANIKRKSANPELERHLVNIERKVVESNQIINNLLYYARIKMPHYETVNIHSIIMECIDTAEGQSKKKVTVEDELLAIKDVLIEADALQIQELFSNILNNAYDAVLQQNGKIKITANDEDGRIKIHFRDNGSGIDRNDLEKVFEPFFTTKAKGTGLGLSVCAQIVNLHSGTINIQSELEKGTIVSVSLPKKR